MKNIHFYMRPFERDATNDVFRQIPLKTHGKLFVSPMPFGAYDKGNRLLKMCRHAHVKHVFVLAQESEIKAKSKKNLFKEYEKIGAAVSHYPFVDMHAPDTHAIAEMAEEAVDQLSRWNVAIHCHAGVGRTSVAASCVVQSVLGLSPDESISYVKDHMEVNMTREQCSVVKNFCLETGRA